MHGLIIRTVQVCSLIAFVIIVVAFGLAAALFMRAGSYYSGTPLNLADVTYFAMGGFVGVVVGSLQIGVVVLVIDIRNYLKAIHDKLPSARAAPLPF